MKLIFTGLQRSALGLVNFAALLALCALMAKWTWVFLAPSPVEAPIVSSLPDSGFSETIMASHLLAGSTAEDSTPLAISLQGVFAAEAGHSSYAILSADGKTILAPVNTVVVPGVTLHAIYPDHVVLEQGGREVRVKLEQDAPALSLENGAQHSDLILSPTGETR